MSNIIAYYESLINDALNEQDKYNRDTDEKIQWHKDQIADLRADKREKQKLTRQLVKEYQKKISEALKPEKKWSAYYCLDLFHESRVFIINYCIFYSFFRE